ncbi:uracil-DNA glycosylase [Arthrobacter sp. Hiyo4]|nr:uracil-DNA glycosylase [Arthrobacter sp. Hiyo4]
MFESDALFELMADPAEAVGFAEMAASPLSELMAADWAEALGPVESELRGVLGFLAAEVAAGHRVLPAPSNVLRAFRQPLADVLVLVVGQDPYPTPGHAIGLSFAVDGRTRPIPRSLANIYRELESDLGLPPRVHGDLSAWASQGVLLLNRVMSVRARAAGSHRGKGWEAITTAAVTAVASRRTADGAPSPLVAVLWGKDAESVRPSCPARRSCPAPTPARCRRRADSSAPGPSAPSTNCCRTRDALA